MFLRYILPEIYHFEGVTFCLTLIVKVEGQGHDIDIYLFEFRDIDLVLIDTKRKFLWYILPDISYWMRYVMFDHAFQGQRSSSRCLYIFFWISRHQFSTYRHQTPSFYDVYYQRYHIECVTSCLTLHFNVKGQGRNYETYFFEFPGIYSVIVDTKHKFLSHVPPEISHVPPEIRHVWPWISRSKVKVTILAYNVLNSLTSV